MIIGNPYKFAYIIDLVDDWSDDAYLNGIFYYSINAQIIPDVSVSLLNTTLNADIQQLIENKKITKFYEPNQNPELFCLELSKVLQRLYSSLSTDYPEANLYRFSTMTMEDEGYYVFCIKLDENIRFISGKVDPEDVDIINPIAEVLINKELFMKYNRKLLKYYYALLSKNME